jgi:ribosomal protein S18 acetylase RimI-like enzyme
MDGRRKRDAGCRPQLMNIVLRSASGADAVGIADVFLDSRKALLPFLPIVHPDAEVREWIRTVVLPESRVLVAQLGEEIVGMCVTAQGQGCGWIEHLYVHPEMISRRIGSMLLASALEGLPRPVRLYTFAENERARRFYEHHGFVAIQFGDGSGNEEGHPDVLYELRDDAPGSGLGSERDDGRGAANHVLAPPET